MYQVSPNPLWIGHAGDGRDFKTILAKRIRVIVQLAIEEPALQAPRELVYLRYPLRDGEDNSPDLLRVAIESVARLINLRIPTLVCCGAGMSRSPLIVAAALAITGRLDFGECLADVTKGRPADVSPVLLADVRATTSAMTSMGDPRSPTQPSPHEWEEIGEGGHDEISGTNPSGEG